MQYNPAFVAHRPILTAEDKRYLHGLAAKYPLDHCKQDARSYQDTVVDFVHTSAQMVGNAYERAETATLLNQGNTAGGKRYTDAVMLVNLRDALSGAMATVPSTVFDATYVCELHRLLMRGLLPENEQGQVRSAGPRAGAPIDALPVDPDRLKIGMQIIMAEAAKYTDPFELAIYLHCNLAYLQYFSAGNRRVARLMQTAALVRSGLLPLFIKEELSEKYQRSTVRYGETGEYAPYVAFFKENYELAVAQLLGAGRQPLSEYEADEVKRRISQLPDLAGSSGAAQVFWLLAREAIRTNRIASQINWHEVERRAIHKALAEDGLSPDDVAAVIIRYSPGAVSVEKQQAVQEDIKRLTPELRAQNLKWRML